MIPLIPIPEGAVCQEASTFSRKYYIACGQSAVAIIYHGKDHRGYYMCIGCAYHNVENRGGKIVTANTEENYQYLKRHERH